MRKINCCSQKADVLVEKVTKCLQLLNGLGTGYPLHCVAEREKEENTCTRVNTLYALQNDLIKGRRKQEARHLACPKAIFCLYDSQAHTEDYFGPHC